MVSTNRLLFLIYYPLSFILKFKNNSDLDINITANISYIICAVEKKKTAGIVSQALGELQVCWKQVLSQGH
jgi:hypothetical protein